LVDTLHSLYSVVHVETNGSHPLPASVDWVTLSPKPPMPIVDQRYNEVKVVYPAVDPLSYQDRAALRYVQPLDSPARADDTRRCVEFVLSHPEWRLSMQMHKALGIP
ncbi:MAG TPA: hypothetical protein VKT78_08245, partial [Fimbriimonadaceae bacterium]|nr:hypothetical protein [Fimbriimonadaceae bacterium]